MCQSYFAKNNKHEMQFIYLFISANMSLTGNSEERAINLLE